MMLFGVLKPFYQCLIVTVKPPPTPHGVWWGNKRSGQIPNTNYHTLHLECLAPITKIHERSSAEHLGVRVRQKTVPAIRRVVRIGLRADAFVRDPLSRRRSFWGLRTFGEFTRSLEFSFPTWLDDILRRTLASFFLDSHLWLTHSAIYLKMTNEQRMQAQKLHKNSKEQSTKESTGKYKMLQQTIKLICCDCLQEQ
jgi:hypothetical protein